MQRFWSKVELSKTTDPCWLWTGCLANKRRVLKYGRFQNKGRAVAAHRFAFEDIAGPIPENLTLDHLCKNTLCVNPWHLEPVTRGVNVLRGQAPPAQNARKQTCPRGHPYSGDNLYERPSRPGYKLCRACIKAWNNREKAD